ncbi:MAG: helix-turn-helix domain-containing protein, partial [Nitrosopumilaceae archaeon]|nr:helix-turn-helix domain-containing protein [Nitrosopumilaceae archaeon]
MPKAALVKRGEEYLAGVQLSELEETYRRERSGKSKDRLQAAILRKRGRLLKEIARTVGRGISTVHRWLSRMEREGLEGRHDGKSPGRPRKLDPEQERIIEEDLDKPPGESGFVRGSWNSTMVARRILER